MNLFEPGDSFQQMMSNLNATVDYDPVEKSKKNNVVVFKLYQSKSFFVKNYIGEKKC